MAGYREFAVGEVLTASNVNDFLMNQSVMTFANSAARGSALGTAVGGGNALLEGMVSYLSDIDEVQYFDGTSWARVGSGLDSSETITATNSSWPVPASADGIFKITVIGGGGGGGATNAFGGTGGTSSFVASGVNITASGGEGGGRSNGSSTGKDGTDGFASGNGGEGGHEDNSDRPFDGGSGRGGAITVSYADLSGISTVNATIGAGGAGASSGSVGGDGGRGEIIVEYRSA